MKLRWRDVDISERCRDMEFSLYRGKGDALLEGVETFKYLRRPLDQTNDDQTTIIPNINQARTVWGGLRKLLRR